MTRSFPTPRTRPRSRTLAAIGVVTAFPLGFAGLIHPQPAGAEATAGPEAAPGAHATSSNVASGNVASGNLASGRAYAWSEPPDADRPDSGRQLTDGKLGADDASDPAWVGATGGRTRTVTIDLGRPSSVSGIRAHFLKSWPTANTLVPLTVTLATSTDGTTWSTLAYRPTRLLWSDGTASEWYAWNAPADGIPGRTGASSALARYVRVGFSVHASAHQLVDEIEVQGVPGRTTGTTVPMPDHPGYLKAGRQTAGIHDLALLYNGFYDSGKGDWTADRIVPYLAHVDAAGRPTDTMFDGVLYLGLRTPNGHDLGIGQGNKADWLWYLDKTFAPDGDLAQLDEAARRVDHALRSGRTKVVLTIPNPDTLADFGDVDGDGVSENLDASQVGERAALANREKVVRWWVGLLRERWAAAGFGHLTLSGLYWLPEQVDITATGPDMLSFVAAETHRAGLKLFWIPHFYAYQSFLWKSSGVDAAALQPNYFFGGVGPERIQDAADTARQYGTGVEFECDEGMLTDPGQLAKFQAYLDGGSRYGYEHGFMAYYQGNDAVLQLARSSDPRLRRAYDDLYAFVHDSYRARTP